MLFINSARRALLTWLHLALVVTLVAASPTSGHSQDNVTTIYIVRHAEKGNDNPSDPSLTEAGKKRAKDLSHVLRDAGLTAIYVSKFKRTQQTAEPTGQKAGIKPKALANSDDIVKDISSNQVGGRILVVGHSDTVNKIAAGLGVNSVPQLGQDQYDRLFVVRRQGTEAYVETLRYGEPTN